MAGQNYLSDSKNPFFALEDDVDDETFLRSAPPRSQPSSSFATYNSYTNYNNDLEQQRDQLMERKNAIEQRTLQSSKRSISLLRDSEQIGAATAEELMRQREQLEKTEKRLDDINSTLRFSQKHIQGIKSVFGSLKNYLSGKSIDGPPPSSNTLKLSESASPRSLSPSPLSEPLDRVQTNLSNNHPALRIRGLLDEEELPRPSDNVSAILEKNLDEMSGSLARLKGLAVGLTEEIDSQNDLIDSVMDKTEKADITIDRQNKDITRLLKK
ncbi:synaptosomal-associated protein 29 [Neodiprion pinetum]|uniref:Synaptosomal-associated protein 29 n=1 Tax=Neodiprion lecontei TaxID=441921 RepID=A0A6J0BEU7_NEOLC|nr:synaptosomal-associated protein 29 [Neodiprion lecontei]XP_046417878.1 synaptosomal-associated protein 29 [Neodiprion fabricii]XP_046473095.1 synaptosomal-associated protein 29 [Neodiprion pinetum]